LTEEHPIHRGLKNKVVEILENSGFLVDSEIHVSFSRPTTDDFSLDVCAIHDDHLLLFECKRSSKELSRQIDHTKQNGPRLNKITKILESEKRRFVLNDFKRIKYFHYCYAIYDTEKKDIEIDKKLRSKEIIFWNNEAIKYFYNTSKMLGTTTKYEILREIGIRDRIVSEPEDAVRIEQNGNELFLLGLQPSKLLKMAYAFRRLSLRNESYQRIVSGKKLQQLEEFYKKKKDFLLANSVIIAFEDEPEIQNEIEWNKAGDRKLHFPTSYSCAWMIDGQHRVYAFKDTKYNNPKKIDSKQFKIPVVAFRKLPLPKQSRTFVNINYYQTKINTVLICDLAASFPDASYELSWASLLVKKLNMGDPWNGKIQTSQTEPKGSISIAGFIRPVLLYTLLGYSVRDEKYHGPLFKIKKFEKNKPMLTGQNKAAFDTHLEILRKFFKSAKKNSWNSKTKKLMWDDQDYGMSNAYGVNALLLVLSAILKKEKILSYDFDKYLTILRTVNFSKAHIKTLSRGYGAYTDLAQEIIGKINKQFKKNYTISY
jgi:DGQHR domain-containing protein